MLDADVSLVAYVEVVEMKTLTRTTSMDGGTSWDGRINGANRTSLLPLFGQRLVLKFPSGEEAGAVLESIDSGKLSGFGTVPF